MLHDLDWTARTDERWVVLGPERLGQDVDPAAGVVPALAVTRHRHRAGRHVRVGRRASRATPHRSREQRAAPAAPTLADRARRSADRRRRRARDVVVHLRRRAARAAPTSSSSSWAAAVTPVRSSPRSRKASASACSSARVLMAEPELLLFDEPCAGLDLGGREAMVEVLADLAHADPAAAATPRDGDPPPRGDPARHHPRAAAARRARWSPRDRSPTPSPRPRCRPRSGSRWPSTAPTGAGSPESGTSNRYAPSSRVRTTFPGPDARPGTYRPVACRREVPPV